MRRILSPAAMRRSVLLEAIARGSLACSPVGRACAVKEHLGPESPSPRRAARPLAGGSPATFLLRLRGGCRPGRLVLRRAARHRKLVTARARNPRGHQCGKTLQLGEDWYVRLLQATVAGKGSIRQTPAKCSIRTYPRAPARSTQMPSQAAKPNPSFERTPSGKLRLPAVAAQLQRYRSR